MLHAEAATIRCNQCCCCVVRSTVFVPFTYVLMAQFIVAFFHTVLYTLSIPENNWACARSATAMIVGLERQPYHSRCSAFWILSLPWRTVPRLRYSIHPKMEHSSRLQLSLYRERSVSSCGLYTPVLEQDCFNACGFDQPHNGLAQNHTRERGTKGKQKHKIQNVGRGAQTSREKKQSSAQRT